MEFKDKNVLVVGLGVSGVSTIKALYKLGAKISIYDSKDESEFKDILSDISHIPFSKYFNTEKIEVNNFHLILKSPGIPPTASLIQQAVENNIEVIGDIELAYRISETKNIIAITGTNGKTTTTTLVGEICKNNKKHTYLAGNIGVPILENIMDANAEDVFVVEASSFQLEHTTDFKPKISLILNITPDHLNWHGSFENYRDSKLKIFQNIIYFSTNRVLESGIYLDGENIMINYRNYTCQFMNFKDLKVKGMHNIENVLGSIGVSLAMGFNLDLVKEAILAFKGVEHRLEYVCTFNGISFYNDSKGTNPESTIKAIESFNGGIILIAGGYNKDSNFDKLIHSFNNKVKALILLGETKDTIKNVALEANYNSIYEVENIDEAAQLAYTLGEEGDNILLSPACASWDMYKNFEERGLHFKSIVNRLKETYYGEIKKQ